MRVELDPTSLAAVLEQVADFTVVVEPGGRIERVSVASEELDGAVAESWVGQSWFDTTGDDGRSRLGELIEEARRAPGSIAHRDVVHISPDGSELPAQYRALYLPATERLIAFGQDLRPMANLRQQLLNAQQALEQDYWRLRQVETRYRKLFDMVADAVLVIDEGSGRVLEANAVASDLLGGGKSIVGKPFPQGLDTRSTTAVNKLLEETRTVGKGSLSSICSATTGQRLSLSASFLRQAGESRFLVQIAPVNAGESAGAGAEQFLQETLRLAPDAVLLTDSEGRVLAANKAFIELAQLASEEQALGRSADHWLGRSGVDLSVLLTNLRQRDVVRLFASTLRGESGTRAEVEISACSINDLQQPVIAFFIRDIGRRLASEHPMTQHLPRSIEQVTQRVGRVPLKELVRESKDVIEALCVEAALKLTHDNRASAAELLGLSRQSLYAKLRRYGIGGAEADSD